jgi:multidrug efflux pump subunit AcrA (membrane-fusion protein)
VPAYPGETFHGVVKRMSRSLDPKTRSMPVELEVENGGLRLAPGMYAQVSWPVRRPHPSLLVPAGSIVTTSERVFVIRLKEGKAEWVNVERGNASGDLVEVLGPLHEGDLVVRRGSDELRPGTPLVPRRSVRAP